MHRAYQPILPSHNKLLQKKWDNTYYNEHRRKVYLAKSMVDTNAPQTYVHMHLKLKKLQIEEEKMSTIERDNRILLEKMSLIMRTRGRVDNRNDYAYRSLNREKRQRELLRVTKENQQILGRITMREPEYNHRKWEQDWQGNEKLMDNIGKYPKNWWKTVETHRKRRQRRSKSAKADDEKAENSGEKTSSEADKDEANKPAEEETS